MTPHTHHWLGAARRSQPRPRPPAPSPDTGRLQRKGVRAPHSLCGRCSRAGHPVALGLQGPPRQQAHWAQHTGSVSTPPQRPRQAARWTGMESSPEPASHPLGLPLQPHPAGERREVREGEGGEHQPTAQHCPGGGPRGGWGPWPRITGSGQPGGAPPHWPPVAPSSWHPPRDTLLLEGL